jgi:hypothetical protein
MLRVAECICGWHGGEVESSDRLGTDLHSSFWVGQLEPGNFKRYASGVILRLLLITHALVACFHVSYGLLNVVELATTARLQMLDTNLPLWRFALSVVLDVMSGVLFVYVVEGVDNEILDGRNRLKVSDIQFHVRS